MPLSNIEEVSEEILLFSFPENKIPPNILPEMVTTSFTLVGIIKVDKPLTGSSVITDSLNFIFYCF